MTIVLDASALLAFLHDETGADQVMQSLDTALVSTVNWSEVVQKSIRRQVDINGMQEEIINAGVVFESFTLTQAELAAQLWEKTQRLGLSLADRACLALALEQQAPVLTVDRVWIELELGIDIQLLR